MVEPVVNLAGWVKPYPPDCGSARALSTVSLPAAGWRGTRKASTSDTSASPAARAELGRLAANARLSLNLRQEIAQWLAL